MTWFSFLFGLGILIYVLFVSKRKNKAFYQKIIQSHDHQELQDEITHCLHILQKHQKWGYCFLFAGWVIIWIGRWSQHPLLSNALFAIPIFSLALLGATKFIENDNELDVRIAKSILEGIKLEGNQGLESNYFQELAKSYSGRNLWIFVFVRISPPLLILISLFNSGSLTILIVYLTKHLGSAMLPYIIIHSLAGFILALTALFFGKIACKPYLWLITEFTKTE